MKKVKTNLLTTLVVILSVLCLGYGMSLILPATNRSQLPSIDGTVFADTYEDANGDTWTYSLSGNNATINRFQTTRQNVTTVTIPSTVNGYTVTTLGHGEYDGGNAYYGIFSDNSGIEGSLQVVIPNTVTSIDVNAFCYGSNITSITIPNGVMDIGEGAFYECLSLTSITIPSSVASIGIQAFYYCENLTSITIPEGVTSIGEWAFDSCTSLTSITIPSSVTSIGNGAFSSCSSLTSITVDTENTIYDSRNNCNAIIETSTNTLIAGCKNTVIPSSVTSIGEHAFSWCTSLTSITIPNSVTSIGYSAFSSCSSLTSITIPNSVTRIGSQAFYSCRSLTSIVIPASMMYIGSDAFYCCNRLVEVYDLSHNQASFDVDADYDYYVRSGGYHTSIDEPSRLVTIDGVVYFKDTESSYSVVGLTDTTITNLTTFDARCTSINQYAFYGCSNLTSITIPSGVTSIGKCVFDSCEGLTTVRCLASVPPTLGDDVFTSSSLTTIEVYEDVLSAYQNTAWGSLGATIVGISKPTFPETGVGVDIIIPSAIILGLTVAIIFVAFGGKKRKIIIK